MKFLEIGIVLTLMSMAGGAYVYDQGQRDELDEATHDMMAGEMDRRATQNELERVKLEIKFLTEASTMRSLSQQEEAELERLKALRDMLEEQLRDIING